MAKLSKSEKYDIFIRSVKGIEGALNGDIYISVDSLLLDIEADIRKVNKSVGINQLGNYKPTEINFDKDNQPNPYKEMLEIISMRENEIIKELNRHIKLADLPEINYYVGRLAALQDMHEILLSKHRNFISKKVENETR